MPDTVITRGGIDPGYTEPLFYLYTDEQGRVARLVGSYPVNTANFKGAQEAWTTYSPELSVPEDTRGRLPWRCSKITLLEYTNRLKDFDGPSVTTEIRIMKVE